MRGQDPWLLCCWRKRECSLLADRVNVVGVPAEVICNRGRTWVVGFWLRKEKILHSQHSVSPMNDG